MAINIIPDCEFCHGKGNGERGCEMCGVGRQAANDRANAKFAQSLKEYEAFVARTGNRVGYWDWLATQTVSGHGTAH